jgi:hypothetical protein
MVALYSERYQFRFLGPPREGWVLWVLIVGPWRRGVVSVSSMGIGGMKVISSLGFAADILV